MENPQAAFQPSSVCTSFLPDLQHERCRQFPHQPMSVPTEGRQLSAGRFCCVWSLGKLGGPWVCETSARWVKREEKEMGGQIAARTTYAGPKNELQ